MAEPVIVKQSQLGIPIRDRVVLGQLTTFKDGSAKWTYVQDVSGLGDQSTFTSTRRPDGTWVWSPTTSTSVNNLAKRENLTADQVNNALYVRTNNLPTSQTQTVLNAGRNTHLGLAEAKKLGLPGANGTATVTGTLPSQVSSGQTPPVTGGEPPANNENGAADGADLKVLSDPSQSDLINKDFIKDKTTGATFAGAGGKSPLKYPENMMPNQDHIKFLMYEYSPKKMTEVDQFGFSGERLRDSSDTQKIVGSVILPIQPSISDTNTVSWNENSLDLVDQTFGALAFDTILRGPEGATATGGAIGKQVQQNKEAFQQLAGAEFAKAAVGSNKNYFTRKTGAIVNPNTELLFEGPTLRTFTFNFVLSARENTEAIIIREIIRFFKRGMAVKRASSNLFLKSPNTFMIKYMYNGSEHPWMNKIKECALQSFSVNYTPAGNYATYPDGSMTSYELTMNFSELDPIYFDDYKNNDPTIGY